MSAEATNPTPTDPRKVACADDARSLEEGDKLRISYESIYGDGSEKTITARVDSAAISDIGLGRVYIHGDGDRDRRPCYEDDSPDRHLQFLMDDIELKMENGVRWQRLSEIATNPTVELIEA